MTDVEHRVAPVVVKVASGDHGAKKEDEERYLFFCRRVMSDVYALLDYLSGRAKPSLASPQYRRPLFWSNLRRNLASPAANVAPPSGDDSSERDSIETDLEDPTALIRRALRIGQSLGKEPEKISNADAAFLVTARDLLNVRATPATGSSIVFTILVISWLHRPNSSDTSDTNRFQFIYKDEHQELAASKLALSVRRSLWGMVILLFITIILSAYVAWGKLLLDTRDAVLHDFGANQSFIAAEMAQAPPTGAPNLVETFCQTDRQSFLIDQSCHQYVELKQRRDSIERQITYWAGRLLGETNVVAAVQQVTIAVGVIGNYVLPVLYGALGAMGAMLRQFNYRLAERLLTPRDRRASHIRMMLGTMTGACIGLFFNSSAGPAQSTGLGGAAVTLSASAVAFLAGYGVESVFRTLDNLINHFFKFNEVPKDSVGGPQRDDDRHT